VSLIFVPWSKGRKVERSDGRQSGGGSRAAAFARKRDNGIGTSRAWPGVVDFVTCFVTVM
jgi:hypothetical protein